MSYNTVSLDEFLEKSDEDRIIKVDMHEPDLIYEMIEGQTPEFDMEVKRAVLETGDYVFQDIGVERKEKDFRKIDDVLVKAEELARKYPKPYVFISTDLFSLIDIEKTQFGGRMISSLRGLVASLIERGINPIFCGSRKNFVRILLKTFDKHADSKNRRIQQPIRPEPKKSDWQVHVISSLPEIGEERAKDLLAHFSSVKAIMVAHSEELQEVDGIGPEIAKKIIEVKD